MAFRTSLFFSYLVFSFLPITVPAAVSAESLGSAYNCAGNTLTLKSKSIPIATAKLKIGDKISSTKILLSAAEKGSAKAAKLKIRLAELKILLANAKSCPQGKYVPAIFKSISKAYTTGAWNNTTFSTSGGMFGSLRPALIEFNLDVGGATFGQ